MKAARARSGEMLLLRGGWCATGAGGVARQGSAAAQVFTARVAGFTILSTGPAGLLTRYQKRPSGSHVGALI